LTLNDFAKRGSVGAITPNPTATKKEAKIMTPTSLGNSRSGFLAANFVKMFLASLE
jgi:hypothetical protein